MSTYEAFDEEGIEDVSPRKAKKGKKKGKKIMEQAENVSSFESVEAGKDGSEIKEESSVERIRTKAKAADIDLKERKKVYREKKKKKFKTSAQDFELQNIGDGEKGVEKTSSDIQILESEIADNNLGESLTPQEPIEMPEEETKSKGGDESKIDVPEAAVAVNLMEESQTSEVKNELIGENVDGGKGEMEASQPPGDEDLGKESAKTEEKSLGDEEKAATKEEEVPNTEKVVSTVRIEYKESLQFEAKYESKSNVAGERELVNESQKPSSEIPSQDEKQKETVDGESPKNEAVLKTGSSEGTEKQLEPESETPSRRVLVPGGSGDSMTGDQAGTFSGPAERGDEDVPVRRNAAPNDSDQMNADDPDSFSAPKIKAEDNERLDANENPVLDHNVLAGKVDDDDDDDYEMPWAMYKNIKKKPQEKDQEDKFSTDYDDDDDNVGNDFKEGDNLPELYEFLGSLDNGDTELESKGMPKSLFDNEQHRHMHQSIDKIKFALAEEEISGYLEEFEKHVEEEVLMIGSIGLEDVQDEERNIRERHIEYQQNEARIQRDKHQELQVAMERAKKHVMTIFREKYGKIRDKEMALMRRDNRLQGQISKAFRRSQNQLIKALNKRIAEVQAMYGDLVFADGQYGGSRGRRWKVDWNKTSQPIQIKIKCLRSVRDKLPLGQYVLMVSLYSRLGGHVMKWSNLKGQKWGAATLPLVHDGEFFNTEMKIDQSVFTVCPSQPNIRPGMVLMFELFILSGPVTPTDKIVGWGCFPVCDGNFNVLDGKYKTPLLRGSIDPSVDKFQAIEERIASDLEYWLCNLYFEIVKLPRYLAGQKEYEVELQFSSGLVSYPIRTKTGEEFVDGEQPVYGSSADMSSIAASRVSLEPSKAASFLSTAEDGGDFNMGTSNIKLTVDPPKRKMSRPSSAVSSSMKLQKASEISTELRQRRSSRTSVNLQPTDDPVTRKSSITGSRRSIDEKSLGYSDETDTGSGTDYNDDDVCIIKKDYGFRHVKGQPGMYYKVHQNNPADIYARKLYRKMPQTAYQPTRKKKKKLTHQDELKQHSYNVKSLWSNKGHMPRQGREKMQYIGRMMLAELGLSQWRGSQFWMTMFMLVITWFIRMYLHYFGQWVLLKALSIPINRFNFYAHTVNLNYQDTLLQARHEIGIVILGPFTNFFFFVLFTPMTFFFQRVFRWFPDIITHFMLAFGIQTFLDPLWILVVDSALGRYKNIGGSEPIGDAFKLYWHFHRNYRNDDVTFYVSVSLTTFLYVVVAFSTCALWYMFFVRLHNNGRLMDVYWRLHGSEDEFFLPYDLEVSNEELNFICMKAEQWRGEEGERRKVAVYDYVWEQEELGDEYWDDPSSHGQKTGTKEITTHLSIHTISPDGLIELYRHFLRLPDGAIIEVFGEMNMPGIDEGVKQALMKKTGFQGTSNVVRRSRSLSVTSMANSNNEKTPVRRMSSNRLDVPV